MRPTWITIPCFPNVPRYAITVPLSGVDFALAFDWHDRESRWYMAVSRSTGEEIARGVKLVPNVPLLKRCASRFRPAGVLFASSQDGEPPLLHDLGTRVLLLYGVWS